MFLQKLVQQLLEFLSVGHKSSIYEECHQMRDLFKDIVIGSQLPKVFHKCRLFFRGSLFDLVLLLRLAFLLGLLSANGQCHGTCAVR